jgi:hypothetical protein
MAIISMAQQASPNVIGQIDDFRAQFTTLSKVVVTTPAPNSVLGSTNGFRSLMILLSGAVTMALFALFLKAAF